MKRNGLLALALFITSAAPAFAQTALIESFENGVDGWTVPSPFGSTGQQANFQAFPLSTLGVTNGAASLGVGATAANTGSGPDYSQLMLSPGASTAYGLNLTSILANATSISFDILAPAGSFGGFLQFDTDINNSGTGFQSLDGFGYPATTIGTETTITIPVTAAERAQLASSGTGTQIIMQVGGGFTAGNETFYIDNVRAAGSRTGVAGIGRSGRGSA